VCVERTARARFSPEIFKKKKGKKLIFQKTLNIRFFAVTNFIRCKTLLTTTLSRAQAHAR